MTCIVALTDGKTVWLGGDAAGVDKTDLSITIRADPKVSVHEEHGVSWGLGFTTSFRMGQLIRYHLNLPKITKDDREDLFRYMVTKFVPELRVILADGGFATSEEGAEVGGEFIVGLLGKIFVIESDFQVGSPTVPYHAVGSGGPYAAGALHALDRLRQSGHITPDVQVMESLKSSENFCAGVRAPFTMVTVPFAEEKRPKKASKKTTPE